jgi:hypothetical protein
LDVYAEGLSEKSGNPSLFLQMKESPLYQAIISRGKSPPPPLQPPAHTVIASRDSGVAIHTTPPSQVNPEKRNIPKSKNEMRIFNKY